MLKKFLFRRVAIILAVVTGLFFVLNDRPIENVKVRTAQLDVPPQYVDYVEYLFDENTYLSGDEESVYFYGYACNVENTAVLYECTFSNNDMTFTMTVVDGSDSETTVEDAIITDTGSLSLWVNLDGTNYWIEDYKDPDALDALLEEAGYYYDAPVEEVAFGWLSALIVAIVVVVYVVVAQTAEQIKAESNYTYNKSLERNGYGPYFSTNPYLLDYCEEQWDYDDYRFGLSTFGAVGCGPATIYNLLVGMYKSGIYSYATQRISDAIYDVEKWGLEIAVSWGHWGTYPRHLYRYFAKKGIEYNKITNWQTFKNYANTTSHYVISVFYSDGSGLHSFYVMKVGAEYHAYNAYKPSMETFYTLDEILNGNFFTVGYLIYEN